MKIIYLQDQNYEWKQFQYERIEDLLNEFETRYIKIGKYAKIGEYAEIGKCNALCGVNLYKYASCSYVGNGGIEMIQLGCYLRTRKEWEDDFWNNIDEFPNDGSEKSEARLRAFKVHCFFLDSLKNN